MFFTALYAYQPCVDWEQPSFHCTPMVKQQPWCRLARSFAAADGAFGQAARCCDGNPLHRVCVSDCLCVVFTHIHMLSLCGCPVQQQHTLHNVLCPGPFVADLITASLSLDIWFGLLGLGLAQAPVCVVVFAPYRHRVLPALVTRASPALPLALYPLSHTLAASGSGGSGGGLGRGRGWLHVYHFCASGVRRRAHPFLPEPPRSRGACCRMAGDTQHRWTV